MAFVQADKGSNGANVSSGSTAGITTTSGNWLGLVVSVDNGPQTVTGITDTYGNTWTPASSNPQAPTGQNTYVYYAQNITGGTGHQVTANFSAAAPFAMAVFEFSGRATTGSVIAQQALVEATPVTSHTSAATGVLGVSGCDVLCLIADDAFFTAGANETYTATSGGWILPAAGNVNTGGSTPTCFGMYIPNVTTASQTATWTNSTHTLTGASVILAIAPAASGGGGQPLPSLLFINP